jgi:hypothetical protein
VAICPATTDKDFFNITVDTNSTNIEVFVDFSTGPMLTLKLLNSNNVEVAAGMITGNRNRVFLANAAAGNYFAAVSGTGNNNYDLTVTLTN